MEIVLMILGALGVLLFSIGFFVVIWEWSVRSNPDAPTGGPILFIGLLMLIVFGIGSCSQAVHDVQQMKMQMEKK